MAEDRTVKHVELREPVQTLETDQRAISPKCCKGTPPGFEFNTTNGIKYSFRS